MARAATTGDGGAFAALYERYERRCFNVAYRIAGVEAEAAGATQQGFLGAMRGLPGAADREPAFRTLLFTATRESCYDLLRERRGAPSSGAVPADGVDDAAMRLPEHQREALALRELAELSYEEIATIMATNRSSVAQLISRARINLHDELRGNMLASVAAPSAECERALPLIAMREDGQLEAGSRDAAWLGAHLSGCERCGLGVEVMQEAAASYRTWVPIAAPSGLLRETMVMVAELTGVDWSEEVTEAAATAKAGSDGLAAEPSSAKPPRRRVMLAVGLAALLLLGGVAAAVFAGDDQPATRVDAAASTVPGPNAVAEEAGAKPGNANEAKKGAAKKKKKTRTTNARTIVRETTTAETAPAPTAAPVQTGDGDAQRDPAPRPNRPSGKTAVEPTQRTSAPKPSTKPKPAPASTPAPQPAPAPAPAPEAEEPPPVEESPGKSAGHADPPGKPADRPPK